MKSLQELVNEYKEQMENGYLQKAYKGLMDFMMDLRTYLTGKYPDFISGSLYQGYMDMTYFPFSPKSLKDHNLKIAIVLIHEKCTFEAWLAGYNKAAQSKYWHLIKESGWSKYRIPSGIKGFDSIIECTLSENPDFNQPDALKKQIEKGTLSFIKDIEEFLSKH
jgi:hypothetical protein